MMDLDIKPFGKRWISFLRWQWTAIKLIVYRALFAGRSSVGRPYLRKQWTEPLTTMEIVDSTPQFNF